jgi:D-serine deaminase-like pyridoxal phosphate-dependent protein
MNRIGLAKTALETPFLWTDLQRLDSNIARLAEHLRIAGVQWRPHLKGIKVPAIAHKALDAGAIGVTCAKLGEAEVMAAAGIQDILIANEIVGEEKIRRLVQLARTSDVKVAVDNPENIAALGVAARAARVTIGVLVEVDIGMHRAGVRPGLDAVALAQSVQGTLGLIFLGLMGWEGHALSVIDDVARQEVVREAVESLVTTAYQCREAGLSVQIVSAGGSATLSTTPFLPGVTEIQAGGAIFCDVFYQSMGVITEPALFVRSRITSRPTSDRIVFDAGFKALPSWKREPEPVGLTAITDVHVSAEHTTLSFRDLDDAVKVGNAYDFVVGYGDQTVFLHDQLIGIRENIVEVVWDIQARGMLQ